MLLDMWDYVRTTITFSSPSLAPPPEVCNVEQFCVFKCQFSTSVHKLFHRKRVIISNNSLLVLASLFLFEKGLVGKMQDG